MLLREDPEHLSGRMLIAMPGIGDPRFERALIFVCAHTDEHAMGIAVNRPLEGLTVPDLLGKLGVKSSIELPPQLVMAGGPVERERGFVLHTPDYVSPDSTMAVSETVGLTATREVLEAMGDGLRRPRQSLLALGYSGWGPGQLEKEIRENVWLTCDPDEDLVFGEDYDAKWNRALAKLGVEAGMLSAQAGRA
jgi:putative transcriptional regulator